MIIHSLTEKVSAFLRSRATNTIERHRVIVYLLHSLLVVSVISLQFMRLGGSVESTGKCKIKLFFWRTLFTACVWVGAYIWACDGCGAPILRLNRHESCCRCFDVILWRLPSSTRPIFVAVTIVLLWWVVWLSTPIREQGLHCVWNACDAPSPCRAPWSIKKPTSFCKEVGCGQDECPKGWCEKGLAYLMRL